MSDLDEFKERYRRSLEAFIQGDPEPQKHRHADPITTPRQIESVVQP